MGAWGSGSFENDDAMDWVIDLEEAGDLSILTDAFEAVTDQDADDLEAPDCAAALAAAEVVAAMAGRPAAALPDEVTAWIAGREPASGPLKALARRAVDKVLAGSELAELWEESDDNAAGYISSSLAYVCSYFPDARTYIFSRDVGRF